VLLVSGSACSAVSFTHCAVGNVWPCTFNAEITIICFTPLQNETTTDPVLNRPTGQRGNNNVANAETLHHFWNSDINNIHDITRPNIGNSSLQPITLDADLRKADNSVNYPRASISKPLALDIDPKIKTIIGALEYIVLGCVLNKKSLK
jgi:hypothetical protein